MSYHKNISSVLKLKCPHCHKGELFNNKNVYKYKGFFDMPNNCEKCNQDFVIEPGFYYGAMYTSYGLTILINIIVFLSLSLFLEYKVGLFLSIDFLILLITLPYIFKISRAIWLAIMVKYDPDAIKNYEAQH